MPPEGEIRRLSAFSKAGFSPARSRTDDCDFLDRTQFSRARFGNTLSGKQGASIHKPFSSTLSG
jgi:hypothetical protein